MALETEQIYVKKIVRDPLGLMLYRDVEGHWRQRVDFLAKNINPIFLQALAQKSGSGDKIFIAYERHSDGGLDIKVLRSYD